MKTFFKYFIFTATACILYILSAFRTRDSKLSDHSGMEFIIHFKATVNGEPLTFKKKYSNSFKESFSVERFKFYFGKARLIAETTKRGVPLEGDEYSLIDFKDSTLCTLRFHTRPGKYNQLDFLLGVDSIRNTTGAQTGALDPSKGMFWTWNSGYVMAKLEGTSPLSKQPAHVIEYHIGGFRAPYNTAREIKMKFPDKQETEITGQRNCEVFINVELNSWFDGPNPIHIAEISTCTTPGELAKKISDNYKRMFSITRIVN